jgi:23S rRNA (uracil1939-C5)-methyltransferase
VIDAYGGVGLFAATVAATAREIVLIEASGSACADARFNLAGLPATIAHTRVEDWQPTAADLVIADPARSGLERRGAARVTDTGAAVIVLVSCDAGSLGRDASLLAELGYRHDGTEVIDVFPNTSHVEAVTRFVRDE